MLKKIVLNDFIISFLHGILIFQYFFTKKMNSKLNKAKKVGFINASNNLKNYLKLK